jgi:hypothetical protein
MEVWAWANRPARMLSDTEEQTDSADMIASRAGRADHNTTDSKRTVNEPRRCSREPAVNSWASWAAELAGQRELGPGTVYRLARDLQRR